MILSALMLALSLIVSGYLLGRFAGEREDLTLGLVYWGDLLAALLLVWIQEEMWVLFLLLQAHWMPLLQFVPPWMLGVLAAAECLLFYRRRSRLGREKP